MKRLICCAFTLIMLLTAVSAMADNTGTSGQYTYEIKGNGTITITKFRGETKYYKKYYEEDIYIPSMIDGYTVTAIGDEAFAQIKLNKCSITLPDGIKSIGDKAFFDTGINAINLPSSLQHIGDGAFYNCTSCQFKLTPNHPYFAVIGKGLYDKTSKKLITYSYGESSANHVAKIPDGIQIIGAYAFAGKDHEEFSVQLPSSLISIGDYAFAALEEEDRIWSGDSKFDEISGDLPNLKTIGEGAFMNCSVYDCYLVMSAVETIGDKAFNSAYIHLGYKNKESGKKYSIVFDGSPLNQIGDEAFTDVNYKGDHGNVFSIDTTKCSNIGIGNKGLGMLLRNESSFSPQLTTIPTGLNPKCSSLPSTVTAIQTGAYTDVVTNFRLSTSLNDIAADAFPKGSTFIVDAGSYAELWCSENGFGYSIEGQNNLDWLSN